jgi:hypothetical protein
LKVCTEKIKKLKYKNIKRFSPFSKSLSRRRGVLLALEKKEKKWGDGENLPFLNPNK